MHAGASGALCASAARHHPCGGGPRPCPGPLGPVRPGADPARARRPGRAIRSPRADRRLPRTPHGPGCRRRPRRAHRPTCAPSARSWRPLAERRVLLNKEAVAYYESVTDFVVAEVDGRVVGCGALHVLWEDLGEVRTLAVDDVGARHRRRLGRARAARRAGPAARPEPAVLPHLRDAPSSPGTGSSRSRARPSTPRSTPSCCAATTRASPSSSTSSGSSRTPWATPGCCASSEPARQSRSSDAGTGAPTAATARHPDPSARARREPPPGPPATLAARARGRAPDAAHGQAPPASEQQQDEQRQGQPDEQGLVRPARHVVGGRSWPRRTRRRRAARRPRRPGPDAEQGGPEGAHRVAVLRRHLPRPPPPR